MIESAGEIINDLDALICLPEGNSSTWMHGRFSRDKVNYVFNATRNEEQNDCLVSDDYAEYSVTLYNISSGKVVTIPNVSRTGGELCCLHVVEGDNSSYVYPDFDFVPSEVSNVNNLDEFRRQFPDIFNSFNDNKNISSFDDVILVKGSISIDLAYL